MHYIGIDISKDYLSVAIKDGESWMNQEIPNTPGAIDEFFCSIDRGAIWVIFEATGTYGSKLANYLSRHSIPFTRISPQQSKGFLQAKQRYNHNDASDARALAEYGYQLKPQATKPVDEKTEQLRQVRQALRQLHQQEQMVRNQLHAFQQQAVQNPAVNDVYQQQLAHLAIQIKQLKEQLCTLTAGEIDQMAKKITTINGIGMQTAREIIIATNGFKNFCNAKQAPKFVGLTPDTKQSGKSVRIKSRISRRGDPAVRQTLYMAALTASRYNLACQALYLRLKQKGKSTKVALVAVAHKLLRQAFAVINSGQDFDNQYYLKFQKT